ncbi:hypothetical protein [Paraburkholderia diazotrophica]|uniref:hypothetical protein n=1 Tax=Paraburkholderia diazotrophica TaxID=667676 RepID=UPI00317E0B08
MSATSAQNRLADIHNPAEYFYLLVDPLAGYDEHARIGIPGLQATLGDDALAIVRRADLAHEPDLCPRLVVLAAPGTSPDPDLVDASIRHAEREAEYDRRYVCGWLSSATQPDRLASGIAERCIVEAGAESRYVPFYEPVRAELLASTSIEDANVWRGPVSDWLYPDASGVVTRLPRAKTSAQRISDYGVSVQAGVPWVVRLLAAWRTAQMDDLSYAPARWRGAHLLPPDAAAQAYGQLLDASHLGLSDLTDQLVFALHRLFIHPRLDTHPQVRNAIARTATGETSLAEQFDKFSDAMWAQIVATLT